LALSSRDSARRPGDHQARLFQLDDEQFVRLADILDAMLGSGTPGDLTRPPAQLLSAAIMTNPDVVSARQPHDHAILSLSHRVLGAGTDAHARYTHPLVLEFDMLFAHRGAPWS
jgi:hypothetical protein